MSEVLQINQIYYINIILSSVSPSNTYMNVADFVDSFTYFLLKHPSPT